MNLSKSETTREAFIAAYVSRAKRLGFDIDPTPDGCRYNAATYTAEGATFHDPEILMVAVPCSCEGHHEGWHMEEADSREGKLHV